MNLADDADLAGQVERIKSILSGVDADQLRASSYLRVAVSGKLAEVKGALDGLLVDGPRRAFIRADVPIGAPAAPVDPAPIAGPSLFPEGVM